MGSKVGSAKQREGLPVPRKPVLINAIRREVEHGGLLYRPYVPCKQSDEWKLKRPNDAKHTSVAKDQEIIFDGVHLSRAHGSQNPPSVEVNHILLKVLFERERQVDRLQL